MKPVLLIDFGSTYTKVTAVDVDKESIIGTASSYTTVKTDINDGLEKALSILEKKAGKLDFAERFACSSAAGGLRMVTCGLVPSLTAEAAKRASLGAGAKVVKVFSYQLTSDDAAQIESISQDILLLTGGTDGGNSECIIANAKIIAQIDRDFPVIIAGNRSAARECEKIIGSCGKQTYICENVMPSFNQLNILPTQNVIRDIFLQRIVKAKGLSKAQELISGILMPTPAAMLKAMVLLSEGYGDESGLSELLAVDLGGATTDVYSISDGLPTNAGTILRGLPEPYAKRTVEGDIGMRYSAKGIAEAAGLQRISAVSKLSIQKVEHYLELIAGSPDILPDNEEFEAFDFALASIAIDIAVTRHVGTLEQVFTPMGQTYLQTGKDLSKINTIIATGGALIHTDKAVEISKSALSKANEPYILKPIEANIYVDRLYILAGMGLLSEKYPKTALKIMKKELLCSGYQK